MPIRKEYNKNFFKTWSREMAYILGFLYADGNVVKTKRNTYFVSFYSADKMLLETIKRILGSDHVISKRSAKTGSVHRLQIGSKEWFEDLASVGLTPNKSARMLLPLVPQDYIGDFIRGYFDGDGNVWVGEVHKRRRTTTKTIQTSFTSASHGFLTSLRDRMINEGVIGGGLYRSKTRQYSRLTYAKKDTLKIYKIMYNAPHKLYLKRKKHIFDTFVESNSSKVRV